MHRNSWSWVPSPSVHRASTETWLSPPTDPKGWLISPIRAYSLFRDLGKAMRKSKQAEHLPLSSSTPGFKQFPPLFEGFWLPWWLCVKEPTCQAGDLGSISGSEDPMEKGMATHFNILAWRITWIEEPGRLQFMGSQRVRHDWATNTHSEFMQLHEK